MHKFMKETEGDRKRNVPAYLSMSDFSTNRIRVLNFGINESQEYATQNNTWLVVSDL